MSTEPPVAPSPPRSSRAAALRVGAVVVLFAAGFGISAAGRALLDSEESPEPRVAAKPGKDTGADAAGEVTLERAERCIHEGKYAAALGVYKALAGDTSLPAAALALRIGQCREALGQTDKALTAYRQAASQDAPEALRGAAQVAQARVLIRLERPVEATHLLYALVLCANDPAASPDVLATARYWLALALSRAALPHVPADDVAVIVTATPLPADPFADLAIAGTAPRAKRARGLEEALALPAAEAGKDRMIRRAAFRSLAAADLFDIIARTANQRLEWTPNAREAVKQRAFHVELEQWRVVDLVAVLADQVELVCQFHGAEIRLATAAEAAPNAHAYFQLDLARWSTRAAVALSAKHRLAAPACLHLANLEAVAGKRQDALDWYEQLLRVRSTGPEAVAARFNQGMLHARAADFDAARQALFRALDLAPAHELAPLALFHIGRMDLEESQLTRAVQRLRRARTIGAGSTQRPRIALLLAAALLMADDPKAAHTALTESRLQLREEPASGPAALLDALARYRVARGRGPARTEAADLIAAIAQVRDPHLLGPIETYLSAGALYDLGLWNQVVTVCAKAIPATRGPMQGALRVKQGEALLRLGKTTEAVAVFQQVIEGKSRRWIAEARYHLAAIELQQGRANECVLRCAELWKDQPCADVAALLRLWGNAYEQLGDYARAARCYAGAPLE